MIQQSRATNQDHPQPQGKDDSAKALKDPKIMRFKKGSKYSKSYLHQSIY